MSLTTVPTSTAISAGTAAFTVREIPIFSRKAARSGRYPVWLIPISPDADLAPPISHIPSRQVTFDISLYLVYDTTMSDGQARIEAEIERVKKELVRLGRMHPGSLSSQKRVRGGEYHQLSYSHGGRGYTKYVRPEDVPAVRQELTNYRRFRELTSKWVRLEIELARLKRDRSRSKKS